MVLPPGEPVQVRHVGCVLAVEQGRRGLARGVDGRLGRIGCGIVPVIAPTDLQDGKMGHHPRAIGEWCGWQAVADETQVRSSVGQRLVVDSGPGLAGCGDVDGRVVG